MWVSRKHMQGARLKEQQVQRPWGEAGLVNLKPQKEASVA